MLETNPIEIKKRVDAASVKLPRIIAKVASLPEAERKLIGHLPTTIKTTKDVSIVEELSEKLGLDASAPSRNRHPHQVSERRRWKPLRIPRPRHPRWLE